MAFRQRCSFLENDREEIEICGMKITLYGLELSQKYFSRLAHGKKLTLQEMEYYLGKKKRDEYAIVLAHIRFFFLSMLPGALILYVLVIFMEEWFGFQE